MAKRKTQEFKTKSGKPYLTQHERRPEKERAYHMLKQGFHWNFLKRLISQGCKILIATLLSKLTKINIMGFQNKKKRSWKA